MDYCVVFYWAQGRLVCFFPPGLSSLCCRFYYIISSILTNFLICFHATPLCQGVLVHPLRTTLFCTLTFSIPQVNIVYQSVYPALYPPLLVTTVVGGLFVQICSRLTSNHTTHKSIQSVINFPYESTRTNSYS